MNPTSTLSARANHALLIKLAAALSTYGFSILLARTMSAQGFGQVAFFLNAALILSVLGGRGQQIAALRFLPPLANGPDTGATAAFVSRAFSIAAKGTIIVFAATLLLTLGAKNLGALTDISHLQIILGFCLIPLVGWVDLQSHIARGFHLIKLSLIPKEILWRSAAAGLVTALFLGQGQIKTTVTSVLWILLITLLIIGLVQGFLLYRATGSRPGFGNISGPALHEIPQATNPFWITSVSNIFLANADVVLVGLCAGTTAAGYYFAANRLAMLLAFPLTSYNVVLGPMLAQAWHKDNRQHVRVIIHSATTKTTVATALISVVLFWLAPQFLGLFGGDFAQATPALRILILAGVINAATGPADIALNMCGFQRQAMLASAASLGLSTLALTIGGLWGGALGVAVAVLAGTVIRKGLFWWLAVRFMSVRTDIFATPPHRQARFSAAEN